MAIPFFRKGKDQSPEVPPRRADPAQAPKTVEGATRLDALSPDALKSAIVVEEVGGGTSNTATDEAAILYANGQVEATEATLKGLLDSRVQRAWAMLFDLYRVTGRNKEFEQLAMDYAVKFEASPPVWQENDTAEEADPETAAVVLPQILDQSAAKLLDEQVFFAGQTAPLRLDFSQTIHTEPTGAESISRILNRATRGKRKLQISGIKGIIKTLQEQTEAQTDETGPWLLLLAIYQLLGRQEEFEDLAVNYAVRFEVSPPSWETVTVAQEVAAAKPRPAMVKDACVWTGIISGEQARAYKDLASFAQTRNPVVVDLSAVTRIDYASVSGLISTLMNILGSGKAIVLQGQNSLVDELLRSMGVQHMAELRPAPLI
ncbi:MAG: STAS domain-containing protein [Thiobacillaceae bacterium]